MLSASQCWRRQCQRDLLLVCRQPRVLVNSTLFFAMICVFFPLTLPPSTTLLKQVMPGILWLAMLFALLLTSERLFAQDYEEGVIEQWLVSGYSIPLLLSAKLLIHWLVCVLPLLIFCPMLALFFHFSLTEMGWLIASFLVGTPTILCLCALVAAFSNALNQKGIGMALILLPLAIPLLIFGGSILTVGDAAFANLLFLLALSILATSFLPFAIAAIIRISLAL